MIKIQNIIASEKFLIIEGGKFQWQCFGDNARYLDFESNTSTVFDSVTGDIYILDYQRDEKFYRYVNQDYMEQYLAECEFREVKPYDIVDGIEAIKVTKLG